MKKKSLRILSLIVAIVMVVAMLPLSALAEETGPKRKVGVVVYGAELTAVLTDIESAFHGNVDFKKSLDQIVDVATKVVDGTGVSVPDVDVSLTAENGKTYKMEEDRSIEIFTDTTEMYIGFQDEVDKQLTKLEYDLAALQVAMEQSNQLTAELSKQITDFKDALQKIREKMNDLKHDLVGMINGLKDPNGNPISLNGMLYRTYVTEEAVPANATYTVKVERFSDTDKDGNAITRDGYILYNDGLESGGSMFNTYRSFPVEVKEQGRFDHEIQFVGPLAGIEGTLELPEAFLKRWLVYANEGKYSAEEVEKEFPGFITDFKWQLVRGYMMQKLGLKVEKQDLEEAAESFVAYQYAMYGMGNVPQELIKSSARNVLEDENQVRRLEEQVEDNKTIAAIREKVSVQTKKISEEKFRALK